MPVPIKPHLHNIIFLISVRPVNAGAKVVNRVCGKTRSGQAVGARACFRGNFHGGKYVSPGKDLSAL